ncbi:unnamed protein product [Caenorhabditis auriculariae]|uniref:Uncharacterized protein n=1 Tax=Caenorhabditis auriculariae TaxID=2777116 RepID=A0A8S1HQM4_9PELO|nr:unnamed protein product [Caenorhabditis auriculariae]
MEPSDSSYSNAEAKKRAKEARPNLITKKSKKPKPKSQNLQKKPKSSTEQRAVYWVPTRTFADHFPALFPIKQRVNVKQDFSYHAESRQRSVVPLKRVESSMHDKLGMEKNYTISVFPSQWSTKFRQSTFITLTFLLMRCLGTRHFQFFDSARLDAKLGITICLRNDFALRCRKRISSGGKSFRSLTDGFSRQLMPTYRRSVIRQERLASPMYLPRLAENEAALESVIKERLLAHDYELQKDKHNSALRVVRNFLRTNSEWVDERLKMGPPLKIPVSRANLGEWLKERKHRLFKSGLHDIFNEFNMMSPHFAYSVHFCRALQPFKFVVCGDGVLRRKDGSSTFPLTVRPSRYHNRPVLGFVQNNDDPQMEEPLKASIMHKTTSAPSFESISGYSSDSAASTATMTPGDWKHNWKLQERHIEYEHRYMKNGYPNMKETKKLAEKEFNARITREIISRRLAMEKANKFCGVFEKNFLRSKNGQLWRPREGLENSRRRIKFLLRRLKKKPSRKEALIMRRQVRRLRNSFAQTKKDLNLRRMGITKQWKRWTVKLPRKCLSNMAFLISTRDNWCSTSAMSGSNTIRRCDRLITTSESDQRRASRKYILWLVIFAITANIGVFAIISGSLMSL